ncbi:MAG: mechanosensitive ion channel family protein, partial [Acidimicrobiia bacterium]|nr:mechanosensitive ion channel family protein [Acidimicrobiia bacterium]
PLQRGHWIDTSQTEIRRADAIARAISWLFNALVSAVAAALVLQRFRVPLATLVPPATIAGVALGFGAQRLVQDLSSGFFLFAERQFTVGDVVTIGPPGSREGVSGTVEEITLRITRLRTLKGEVVVIPNGEIRQVINLSVDWARIVIDVPLRAQGDVDRAIELLAEVGRQMCATHPWDDVLLETPEVLGVEALDVDYLRLRLAARVRAHQQWEAGRELRRRVAAALADAGIAAVPPIIAQGASDG